MPSESPRVQADDWVQQTTAEMENEKREQPWKEALHQKTEQEDDGEDVVSTDGVRDLDLAAST